MEDFDFEIYRVWGEWGSNVFLLLAFLVLILSAYLVAAYRAGPHLQRSQVIVLTSLMLWFSYLTIILIGTGLQVTIDMREQAFFGYTTLRNATAFKWILAVGCSAAPLACVSFMYQMRHPRGSSQNPVNPAARPRKE